MHAILSYRGNRPTNKQTQPQTHRQDRLQYTAPQLVLSVIIMVVLASLQVLEALRNALYKFKTYLLTCIFYINFLLIY